MTPQADKERILELEALLALTVREVDQAVEDLSKGMMEMDLRSQAVGWSRCAYNRLVNHLDSICMKQGKPL